MQIYRLLSMIVKKRLSLCYNQKVCWNCTLSGEVHSYDVLEILAFSVAAGNKEYLEWIVSETSNK